MARLGPRRAAGLFGLALAPALALGVWFAVQGGGAPDQPDDQRLAHGTVVLLQGTPHYWVADEAGVLHWASDTRALVGRYARWNEPREITLEQLERLPRGEAWLAAPVAFVQGRDHVYLVRWDTGLKWPALLRVPSVEALAPFGITAAAIERQIVDQQTWERLTGLRLAELETQLTPATLGLPPVWQAGEWSGSGTQVSPPDLYPVTFRLSKATLDPALGVVVGTFEYPSFPCSGQLSLLWATAEEALLAERLTSGLENCTDQGRVTLERRSEWRLFYVWSLPDDPMAVTGHLMRADALD